VPCAINGLRLREIARLGHRERAYSTETRKYSKPIAIMSSGMAMIASFTLRPPTNRVRRVINDPGQLAPQIFRLEIMPPRSEIRSIGNRQACRCRLLPREN
jgi:hypothetical protein